MSKVEYSIGQCYKGNVPPEYLHQTYYTGVSYVSWYLVSGSVRVEASGRTIEATTGDWVFMEPLTTKSHAFSERQEIISMRFHADLNGLFYFPPVRLPWIYRGPLSKPLMKAADDFCTFESEYPPRKGAQPPSYQARRDALFNEWLYHWHRLRESVPGRRALPMSPRVTWMLDALGSSIDIKPVDYDSLSKAAGLSRAQINRVFKQATGITPKQWKEASCLRLAEDLLASNDLSIKEIAARLGFTDSSHFTKWFRGKMGQTPVKWRRLETDTQR